MFGRFWLQVSVKSESARWILISKRTWSAAGADWLDSEGLFTDRGDKKNKNTHDARRSGTDAAASSVLNLPRINCAKYLSGFLRAVSRALLDQAGRRSSADYVLTQVNFGFFCIKTRKHTLKKCRETSLLKGTRRERRFLLETFKSQFTHQHRGFLKRLAACASFRVLTGPRDITARPKGWRSQVCVRGAHTPGALALSGQRDIRVLARTSLTYQKRRLC